VDDHQLVQTGLRMLIESQPEMTVVGKAGNCAEALDLAAGKNPNLILLDIDLGSENGLDLLPKLRETAPDARVLILTGMADVENARASGAAGRGGAGFETKCRRGALESHSESSSGRDMA